MLGKILKFGILRLAPVPATRKHREFSVADTAKRPNAVPFDFIEPLVTGRRFRHRRCEHRIESRWHRGFAGARDLRVVEPGRRPLVPRRFRPESVAILRYMSIGRCRNSEQRNRLSS